jgi:Rps23 Pro-64 3,4-dihydroxylase Tpa1-like proline 4-hydroxylase
MSSLKTYENILPIDLIQEIRTYVQQKPYHQSSYAIWDRSLILNSSPVIIFKLPEHLAKAVIDFVKVAFEIEMEVVTVLYQAWPKLSYIAWHDDNGYNKAITIYLNEYWDINWGGYFAYERNQIIECIKPSFNKAIQIEAPLSHAVFSTTIDAPIRETLQIFIKDESLKTGDGDERNKRSTQSSRVHIKKRTKTRKSKS